LLRQETRFCRPGCELGRGQVQVPDQEERVAEAEPLPVWRGFESSSFAFLLRPPEHGFEEADLVGVDRVLCEDDAECAVFNVFEGRLGQDFLRLGPDDLQM